MKEAKKKASGAFLRQSIKEMNNIQQGLYTQDKHNKKLDLEEKADHYFSLYLRDELEIDPKDYETFAVYIDKFADVDKEALFNKLQAKVSFNVRESVVKKPQQSWWQKLWHKKKYPYLNTAKLTKRTRRFEKMRQMMDARGFHGAKLSNQLHAMSQDAFTYIEAYNQGLYTPKAEDVPAFTSYIKTMGQFYKGSPAEQAVQKLETETAKVVSMPAPTSTPTPKPAKKRSYIKRVAVAAMLIVGSWLGFGSDSSSNDKTPSTPQPAPKFVKLPTVSKFAMPTQMDYSLDQFIKLQAQQTQDIKTVQMASQKNQTVTVEKTISSEQRAWNNFYQKRLAGFTSEARAQAMIDGMQELTRQGIINLPQDISVQKYLYAQEVYRRYGFKTISTEMSNMLKSPKTLSAEQQGKLFEYVRKAGNKGVGVRKMAERMQRNNLWQVKQSRQHQIV